MHPLDGTHMPQFETNPTSLCLACIVIYITSCCSSPWAAEEPAHFCHHQPSTGWRFGSFHNSAMLLSEVLVQTGLGVALGLSHELPHSTVVTWVTATCSPQGDHQQLVCPSFVWAADSRHPYLHISFCAVSPGFTLRPVQTQRM